MPLLTQLLEFINSEVTAVTVVTAVTAVMGYIRFVKCPFSINKFFLGKEHFSAFLSIYFIIKGDFTS